jgi:hypothetical protein
MLFSGLISLLVPETLNRRMPQGVDDVVKWPLTLSRRERININEINKNDNFNFGSFKKKLIPKEYQSNATEININENENEIDEFEIINVNDSIKYNNQLKTADTSEFIPQLIVSNRNLSSFGEGGDSCPHIDIDDTVKGPSTSTTFWSIQSNLDFKYNSSTSLNHLEPSASAVTGFNTVFYSVHSHSQSTLQAPSSKRSSSKYSSIDL